MNSAVRLAYYRATLRRLPISGWEKRKRPLPNSKQYQTIEVSTRRPQSGSWHS
jgi:hypothetical protein